MVIGEYGHKECYKNENKPNTCECEHIESLIVHRSECAIYPSNTTDIEESFYESHNPEYTTMNLVENNQKCEVDKWKEEHKGII